MANVIRDNDDGEFHVHEDMVVRAKILNRG